MAIQDRNTVLAHSDSEAWNLRPIFHETTGKRRILVPLHNDTRAPLIRGVVEQLAKNCDKFMDVIMVERKRLEKGLADHFPKVKILTNSYLTFLSRISLQNNFLYIVYHTLVPTHCFVDYLLRVLKI